MADLFSEFEWFRHPSGYQVVTAVPTDPVPLLGPRFSWMNSKTVYLVPKRPGERCSKYFPFRDGGVVERFGSLARSRDQGYSVASDDVLAFVDQFGLLWGGATMQGVPDRPTVNPFLGRDARAESELREVNALHPIASFASDFRTMLDDYADPGRLKAPGAAAKRIARVANDVASQLGGLEMRLLPRRSGFGFVMKPPSLIAAIWIYQMAEFGGDAKVYKCMHCATTFTTRKLSRGIPRKYCSDRCKTAWGRANRGNNNVD